LTFYFTVNLANKMKLSRNEMESQGYPPKRRLEILMNDICVDLGFCLPAEDLRRILAARFYNADQFTEDVFGAEKMKPEDQRLSLKRVIRRRFTDLFGNHVDLTNSDE